MGSPEVSGLTAAILKQRPVSLKMPKLPRKRNKFGANSTAKCRQHYAPRRAFSSENRMR
jgi:hypothetical protein